MDVLRPLDSLLSWCSHTESVYYYYSTALGVKSSDLNRNTLIRDDSIVTRMVAESIYSVSFTGIILVCVVVQVCCLSALLRCYWQETTVACIIFSNWDWLGELELFLLTVLSCCLHGRFTDFVLWSSFQMSCVIFFWFLGPRLWLSHTI